MKNLPSTQAKNHINKDGEILKAQYREGIPRQYRFNASTGNLNINGEEQITKSGETFKIAPRAIRIFKENLFEMGYKTWAEIFFLNQKNQMSAILFHGYSVENLMALESDLFYEDLKICDTIIEVKPCEKKNKVSNSKYYIAEFSFQKLNEETKTTQEEAIRELRIYRKETLKPQSQLIVAQNYNYEEIVKLIN